MTEEQFKKVYDLIKSCGSTMEYWKCLEIAKMQPDIIRKPDLEILVEEAESFYNSDVNFKRGRTVLEVELYNVIQALKKDHPEFKK